MKRIPFFFCLVCLFSTGTFAQYNAWHRLYPTLPGNWLTDVQFINPSVGYAVGEGGAFLKSTDGGDTWEGLSSGFAYNLYALSFINEHEGLLAGQAGLIQHTTDGGETWTVQRFLQGEGITDIELVSSTVGYAVGYLGELLKTTDGGVHWVELSYGYSPSMLHGVYFQDELEGWVVGQYGSMPNALILHTTDGGVTWTNQYNDYMKVYGITFLDADTAIAVGADGASRGVILRTTNRGAIWQEVRSGIDVGFCDVGSTTGGVVVAVGMSEIVGHGTTILRSTDAGINWVSLPSSPVNRPAAVAFADSLHGIIVASYGNILKSNDGGTTWQSESARITTEDISDVAFPVAARGLCLTTTPGGSRFFTTVDGGITWAQQGGQVPFILFRMSIPDSSTCFAVGVRNWSAGRIVRSTDFGISWDTVYSGGASQQLRAIHFFDRLHGMATGYPGSAVYTSDGGQTWLNRPINSYAELRNVCMTSPYTAFASGGDGVLFRTTDAGMHWQALGSGTALHLGRIAFFSPLRGVVLTSSTAALLTTNGGDSWTTIPTGVPLSGIATCGSTFAQAVGPSGARAVTADGGQTWIAESAKPMASLGSVAYVQSQGWIACGSEGTIMGKALDSTSQATFNQGWNLVSVSFNVGDYRRASLFPGALTPAYAFGQNQMFVQRDTLRNGEGYWLKFSAAANMGMAGAPRTSDTIVVGQGWNLVGSISAEVPTSTIEQVPLNNLISCYEYNSGLRQVDVIRPGKGYWVHVSHPGHLILSANASAFAKGISARASFASSCARLRITDRSGASQELFFASMRPDSNTLAMFTLPPRSPEGVFDVRFSSDRMLAFMNGQRPCMISIAVSSANYPLSIEWDLNGQLLTASLVAGNKEALMNSRGSTVVSDPNASMMLKLGGPSVLPNEFTLHQNYPNPFNPSTTIKYDIPVDARVSLRVFDLLGREVATLVNDMQKAGFKSVEWNAREIASGVYFYRLEVGNFVAAKKLVLLR